MRVLVLHAELGTLRGGGETFSRHLFESLVALGHDVRAAFTANPFGRYPFALPPGIDAMPVRGLWSRSFGHGALSAVGRRLESRPSLLERWDYVQNALSWRTVYWYNQGFQRRVVGRLDELARDADLVYVHSNAYLAAAVAQTRPTVLRLPGPLPAEFGPLLRRVHAVVANGDALTCLREFLGDVAVELPVGIDQRLFAPGANSVRSSLGWADQKIVGYVGRLARIKGVDVLAEGFRELCRRRSDARLLLIGTGEEEKNLRGILRTELAGGLVRFAGDVAHERLAEWYRAMDVLVMPSRYENYSNALLEGLACGVPFVGSDVGGNRMLHQTGAGWLFAPGSPESLAAVLDAALAMPAELVTRGRNGRSHVESGYSWLATARRLEDIARTLSVGHNGTNQRQQVERYGT
jgi:glycosyltransferase involved in cell wall biosynthesis